MRFWQAYLRASAFASVITVLWVGIGTLINISTGKLSWDEQRLGMLAALLSFILLTFGFTLVLGGVAHWFLRTSGSRKRLHYIAAGSALGALTALLTYSSSAPWAVLLNALAFAAAGCAAATTFWTRYVRGA
jgi:hypothetical protein